MMASPPRSRALTPLKRSSVSAGFTPSPYANKLPKFESKTGSFQDTEDANIEWRQLNRIITDCQQNRYLIKILFNKMMESQQKMATHGSILQTWGVAPKNIMGLPDTFVMGWVIDNTDLTEDYLVAAKLRDPKAAHKIMIGMTQLPETLKIEEELVFVAVMKKLLDFQFRETGQRLRTIVADGGIDRDGRLYFADVGAYKLTYTEGKLTMIEHTITKDKVEIDPNEFLVTVKYDFLRNWSDVNAELRCFGKTGEKLINQFAKEPPKGPHKFIHYTGIKSVALRTLIEKLHLEVLDSLKASTGGGGSDELQQKLKDAEKEGKKAAMEKVKAAGKEALKKKKELSVSVSKQPRAKAKAEPSPPK
jgi:hypothetical protein